MPIFAWVGRAVEHGKYQAMSVTMICPNLKCRAILQVPDKARGKKVRCGQCRTAFMVPQKGQTPGKLATPGKAAPQAQGE